MIHLCVSHAVHGYDLSVDAEGSFDWQRGWVPHCLPAATLTIYSVACIGVMKRNWRQIWRVAGRESGSRELLGSPPTSPGSSPKLPRKFFGDFPGGSLTVELSSNPGVPRKFPGLPRKFPKLPRKFPKLPRRSAPFSGKPDTLS